MSPSRSRNPDPTQLLTTAQVAERLGVSVDTVQRWARAGIIAYALKVPGRTGGYMFDPRVVAS